MKKKCKIFADAYLKKNLGDDLFLKILSDRYSKCDIYAYSNVRYPKKNLGDNVHMKSGILIGIINKIYSFIFKKGHLFNYLYKKKCDITVIIGGSLFIEPQNINVLKNKFEKEYKPYCQFILGTNFGPYKTDDYIELIKNNVFKYTNDICFRDNYSYQLFKDLDNIRVANDIVFNIQEPKKKENENYVIISVINCKAKGILKYEEKYLKFLKDIIVYFYKKNFKIKLMSFCKYENDEETIKVLKRGLNNIEVETYFYNGNTDEALEVLSNSKIIVGSRFHANIIGLKFKKKIIPIAYSDKTINALKDLKYEGNIFDIRNFNYDNLEQLIDENLNYVLDIKNNNAQLQFLKLDKEIKGEHNE